MTSTKKDIVRDVAMKTGFDIVTVKEMVQAMFDAMCEGLAQDQNIEIRNFGIFRVKYTPERKARNPKTSEIITVPAKRHINFKPGQQMKLKINEDLLDPATLARMRASAAREAQRDAAEMQDTEAEPSAPETFGSIPPGSDESRSSSQ